MNEYCIMKNGDNVHVEYDELKAISFAIGYGADKVIEVFYEGETEVGIETIWERSEDNG